ncbi:hypothetical protein ACE8FZ_04020 [Peribacillus frigoritolerans]|uniref:hypothetical protein n=1 Tax=Peribacillus frigoritolerans TaxID=450367 RepID=UPI0035D0A36D
MYKIEKEQEHKNPSGLVAEDFYESLLHLAGNIQLDDLLENASNNNKNWPKLFPIEKSSY